MDPVNLIGLAVAFIGLGLTVNPSFHNTIVSWILLLTGSGLLIVGAVRAWTRRYEVHPTIQPRPRFFDPRIWNDVLALAFVLIVLFGIIAFLMWGASRILPKS
jgi:magnesium-transporting ATPase (P-type)